MKLSRLLYSLAFAAVLVSAISLSLAACTENTSDAPAPPPVQKISILHFNDFHGHLEPFKRHYKDTQAWGGLMRMATLVKRIRQENESKGIETLFLSSGDTLQGSLLSTAFKGEAEFLALDKLGLTAMAVGNHEFDFGPERLFELERMVNFPLLSSNIHMRGGSGLLFKPYELITGKNGLRIAIVGLTTAETPITTLPENVEEFRFVEPELAMQSYFDDVDRRSDLIILLSHLGRNIDEAIARRYPETDIILGGHTHTLMAEPKIAGEVIISQAGDHGLYLGRLDIEIKKDRAFLLKHEMIPIKPDVPEDPETKKFIQGYSDKLSAEYKRQIGYSKVLLDGERSNIRTKETNLGDLATDAMRNFTKTDVALLNGGAIRDSIHPGPVLLENAMQAFPMNNKIFTMIISGEDLFKVLKHSIRGITGLTADEQLGGFLQVSGLSFEVDKGIPKNITVNGKRLVLYKSYKVATIDFLAAGGDGYKQLLNADAKYNTGVMLHDLVIEHFKKHHTIYESNSNKRIIRQ